MSKEQLPDLLFDDKSTADCLQKDKTSSVYRGYWKGNTAAITFYKDFSEEKFLKLRDQTRTLEPVFKKTQHIVKIFDLRYDDACLVMEYVTKNSTLENCIETKSTSVTSAEKETKYDEIKQEVKDISRTDVSTWPLDLRLRISLDIVNGLQALHENKIAHPDFTIKNILLKTLPNKPLIAKLLIKPQYQEQKRGLEENLFSTNIKALGEILHKIFLNPTLDIPPTVDILISQCYEPNPKNRPSLDEFQRTLTTLLKSQPYSQKTKKIEAKLWKQHEMAENKWPYPRYIQNKIYSLAKDLDLVVENQPEIPKILDIDIIQKLRRDIEFFRDSRKFDHFRQDVSNHDLHIYHITEAEMSEYKSTMHSFSTQAILLASECREHLILLEKAKQIIEKQLRLDKRKELILPKSKAPKRETFSLFGLLPGFSYMKEMLHEKMLHEEMKAQKHLMELELKMERLKMETERQEMESFFLKSKLEAERQELEFSLLKSKMPEREIGLSTSTKNKKLVEQSSILTAHQDDLTRKTEGSQQHSRLKKELETTDRMTENKLMEPGSQKWTALERETFPPLGSSVPELSNIQVQLHQKREAQAPLSLLKKELEVDRKESFLLKSKAAKKETPQLSAIEEPEVLSRLDNPLRYQVPVLSDGLKLLEKAQEQPVELEMERLKMERLKMKSFLLESKLEAERQELEFFLLKSKAAKKETPQLSAIEELEVLSRLDNPLRYQVLILSDGLKLLEKEVHLPTLNLEDEKICKKIIKTICDKFNISEWVLNRAIGFYLKPDQFQEFKKQVKLDKRRQKFFKLRDDYLKIVQSIDNLLYPYDEKNKDQDYIRLNTLLLRQLFATLNYLIEMATAKYPDWLVSNKELINELIDKYNTNITVSELDKHFTLVKSMLNEGETYTADNYKKMTENLSQQFTMVEFEIYQGFLSLIAENMNHLQDCKEIVENIFFQELSKFITDLDGHFNEISEMNDTVLETFSNYKNNFSRLEIRKSSDETLVQNIYSDQLYLINSKLEQKPKPEEKEQLLKIKQNILKKQQKILEKQENLKKQMGEVSYELLINKNKLVLQCRHLEKNLLTLQQDLNELAYKINLFFKKNPGAQSKSIDLFDEMNEILKVIIEDFLRKISKNSITTDKINLVNKIMVDISGYISDINGMITRNQSFEVSQRLKSSLFVEKDSKYQTNQKENEEAVINKIISIKDVFQKFIVNSTNSFTK